MSVALFPESGDATPASYVEDTDPILEAAAALPGVQRASTHLGLTTMYLGAADGRASFETPETIGSLDGRFTETDRVTLQEGRVPDPARTDEVLVNTFAAERYDMPVGSRHELVTIAGGDEVVDATTAEVVDSTSVRVVGIGRFPEEILRDEYDADGFLLATPALTTRYLEHGFPYRFQALHLSPGTDPSEVVAAYEELSGTDYGVIVRRTDEQRAGAQLALRPVVVALAVFGLLTLAAALALGSLAVQRVSAAAGADVPLLRALGASRGLLGAAVAMPALGGLAVGAVGAVVVALGLSPMAPVGPIRDVEPAPGLDLDATVVLGGAAALFLFLAAVALAGTALVVRRRGRVDRRSTRPTRVSAAVAKLGIDPAGAVGVREGLGVGSARAVAAARSTLASCALAVVAVVATLTFGASIDGLLETPHRFGWAADRAFVAGAGYITVSERAADAVAADPDVRAVAVASYAPVQLGDRTVSAVGLDAATGDTAVTVLEGGLPRSQDQVALGVNTARQLGVGVGDRISSDRGRVTVVGIAALPAIGLAGVSHPSMAQGAVLTPRGLAVRNPAAFTAVLFVDFVPGADVTAAGQRARASLAEGLEVSEQAVQEFDALRPAELVEVDSAKATALGLAVVLVLAATLALLFTLNVSVRRRRGAARAARGPRLQPS